MIIGKGFTDQFLTNDEILSIVGEGLQSLALDDKRALVIIPDGTRSMPVPLMFDLFEKLLAHRVKVLDYLVALGTHQPMTDAQLSNLVGRKVVNGQSYLQPRMERPNEFCPDRHSALS
jgi:nickel-dependent lactate racemase